MTKHNKTRSDDFHVTSIVYGCVRRALWERKAGTKPVSEDEKLYKPWIGTKLHETPITDGHEIGVKFKFGNQTLTGGIDEILKFGDDYYIIDKKFVWYVPRETYPHHIEQMATYATILFNADEIYKLKGSKWKAAKNKYKGIKFRGMILYYIDMVERDDDFRVHSHVHELTDSDYDYYRQKIDSFLNECLEHYDDELPPNIFDRADWACKYCRFEEICKEEWKRNRNDVNS